jgi:hypothetical protein
MPAQTRQSGSAPSPEPAPEVVTNPAAAGGAQQVPPAPAPSAGAAAAAGGVGLDAGTRVLAQVEDYCSAIGAAGAAPTPDRLSTWLAAFLATEKLLLLELFPRVGAALDLASGLRLTVPELADRLLAHEEASRPPPPESASEQTNRLLRELLGKHAATETRLSGIESELKAKTDEAAGLKARLLRAETELREGVKGDGSAASGGAGDPWAEEDDDRKWVEHHKSEEVRGEGHGSTDSQM